MMAPASLGVGGLLWLGSGVGRHLGVISTALAGEGFSKLMSGRLVMWKSCGDPKFCVSDSNSVF